MGSDIVNSLPCPSRVLAKISPECARIIDRARLKPSPFPGVERLLSVR